MLFLPNASFVSLCFMIATSAVYQFYVSFVLFIKKNTRVMINDSFYVRILCNVHHYILALRLPHKILCFVTTFCLTPKICFDAKYFA